MPVMISVYGRQGEEIVIFYSVVRKSISEKLTLNNYTKLSTVDP